MLTTGTLGAVFKLQPEGVYMGDQRISLAIIAKLRSFSSVRSVTPTQYAGVFQVVAEGHIFTQPFEVEFQIALYQGVDKPPLMQKIIVELAVFG